VLLPDLSQLLLTFSSKYGVPQSTITFILEKYQLFLKESSAFTTERLVNELSPLVPGTDLRPIIETIMNKDPLVKLHSSKGPLRSAYLRKKEYSSSPKYVPPIGVGLKMDENKEEASYHYVPIADTLKVLLEDDSVYEQFVQTSRNIAAKNSLDLLNDISDGTLYKNHPVFSVDPEVIQDERPHFVRRCSQHGECSLKCQDQIQDLGNVLHYRELA